MREILSKTWRNMVKKKEINQSGRLKIKGGQAKKGQQEDKREHNKREEERDRKAGGEEGKRSKPSKRPSSDCPHLGAKRVRKVS